VHPEVRVGEGERDKPHIRQPHESMSPNTRHNGMMMWFLARL
jgi:hypothetical protein